MDREQRNLQQKNGANRTQVVHDPSELFTMWSWYPKAKPTSHGRGPWFRPAVNLQCLRARKDNRDRGELEGDEGTWETGNYVENEGCILANWSWTWNKCHPKRLLYVGLDSGVKKCTYSWVINCFDRSKIFITNYAESFLGKMRYQIPKNWFICVFPMTQPVSKFKSNCGTFELKK